MNKLQTRATQTRQKLLDLTGRILAEEGYAALTEDYLCQQAGLTRGALRYHFPSGRYALLAAFAEQQLARQQRLFDQLGPLPARDRTILALLAMQLRAPSAGTQAVLELWMAMRGDARLAQHVQPILEATWSKLLGDEGASGELLALRFLSHGASLYAFSADFNAQKLAEALDWMLRRLLGEEEWQAKTALLARLQQARNQPISDVQDQPIDEGR